MLKSHWFLQSALHWAFNSHFVLHPVRQGPHWSIQETRPKDESFLYLDRRVTDNWHGIEFAHIMRPHYIYFQLRIGWNAEEFNWNQVFTNAVCW